jgi:hypothetical protein
MLGAACSPCCGPKTCDSASMNSLLASLTPKITISGSWPIPSDIGNICQLSGYGAGFSDPGQESSNYVRGSLAAGSAPWINSSVYWRGYKPYSGGMIGTHDLILYPPGSSTGAYAFRRDYGDGRFIEVIFRNAGADRRNLQNAAKFSEDNPCYVNITIQLKWQQPLYYTSSRVPATYSISTFSSGGGTFTCAVLDDADFFQWKRNFSKVYNSSYLRELSVIFGTIPGVATDAVSAEVSGAKGASVESFGVGLTPDPFFPSSGVDTVALNNHELRFAIATGEFWNPSGSFAMQTMPRNGSWFPLRQASSYGAWNNTSSWTTKPSLSFVGATDKRIEISASRVGDVNFLQTDFDATVSLSLT